jgi:hypothetical protein
MTTYRVPLLMVSRLCAVPFTVGDALVVGRALVDGLAGPVGVAGAEEAGLGVAETKVGAALAVSSGPQPVSRSAVPVTADVRAMAVVRRR